MSRAISKVVYKTWLSLLHGFNAFIPRSNLPQSSMLFSQISSVCINRLLPPRDGANGSIGEILDCAVQRGQSQVDPTI